MENNLKERRKALGLRLEDVLKLLDPDISVSYGSLWNYENGRPGGVIMSKYLAVVNLYDRLEKENEKRQENNEPC